MATQPKNIIIIGGSLAGLMTGLTLKHLGHTIRIYERSPTTLLHSQGAGIVFGPEAQSFFSQHVHVSRSLSISSKLRQTLNRDGSILNRDEREQKMVSWDLLYFCLRACFDGLKSSYCETPERKEEEGKGKYFYARKVTGVKDLGEQVEVEFEDVDADDLFGSEKADLVIAADGPSSSVRKLLLPEVVRTYAGYVAWRGTVVESEASKLLKTTFVDHFTFFHGPGIQILSYLIPGENGSLEPGKRLINWVWYCNYPADSPEYKDLMTDSDGHFHHTTMPVGKIQDQLWTQQKEHAKDVLPAAFSELVCATKMPFVQAITDVISPQASFFNKKLLLVGDAVAGFRPHTAASTSQAAYHALLVEQMMKGEISNEMLDEMMDYARHLSAAGQKMGNRSQFGDAGINLKVS
ncbi:related to 2-polyprenyl-6-methoxyphenol hydroxylase and related FAD-dependent oxidoreductases [Phialocephala subalpina]|uniref:Related to 2-polyprenyl-6-methoxyphenol hydroxylase and related FAD-dependent oxidoreductases n=1 Tax=Phialocephala subalpina TaxID=576137 RepID=A0A1L7X3D0_9HELO|nr:related to 2-polyprenyl-6-methoxyphenol hydroxylase and related FAD-dependent oxidoreductases [Phialocephala subalpina]